MNINAPKFKKLLFLLLFFGGLIGLVQAQPNIVIIKHKYYTSWFSTTDRIPLVVNYKLTSGMLGCGLHIPRAKRFTPDPDYKAITNLNNDYKKSGYDRGHNMNADDNHCDEIGMKECFYFSNMTPQPHSFNAGRWEELEKEERHLAELYQEVVVTCGSVGKQGEIGDDHVVVPKYMWKVIYIPATNQYLSYVFPNTENVHDELLHYEVKFDSIKRLAPVYFKNGQVTLNAH